MARLGADKGPWHVSDLNEGYDLCSSYPSVLVLPRRMTADEIRKVAKFRKRGRLPAMSWCGPEICRGSIWRCAQPQGVSHGLETRSHCLRQQVHGRRLRERLSL